MTVQELLILITVIQCFTVRTDSGLQMICKLNNKAMPSTFKPDQPAGRPSQTRFRFE